MMMMMISYTEYQNSNFVDLRKRYILFPWCNISVINSNESKWNRHNFRNVKQSGYASVE